MRFHEFSGVSDKFIFPVTETPPEPEVTTAYPVYPDRLKHLTLINDIAAHLADIALKNLDKPSSEDWRLGVKKFRDVQRKADAAFAKHLAQQDKKFKAS